jgi:hypothetical protein
MEQKNLNSIRFENKDNSSFLSEEKKIEEVNDEKSE